MAIKHRKVSAIAATTDTTLVSTTDWNDLHTISVEVFTASGNTTLDDTHEYVRVSATATITLPTAVGRTGNRTYIIKNVGTGVVAIATTSAQTIDGFLSWSLPSTNDYVELVSNGTGWEVIGNNV